MNPSRALPPKTLKERILHTLAFEGLAIALSAPALAWLMGKSLLHTGALTLAVSTLAMLWNMAFNAAFDRAQQHFGFDRTAKVRIVHALLFELGLIVATIPLAAWWLSIGLVQAFFLDIGLLLFFLPYTLGFNWAYDALRARWLAQDVSPALETADARGRA